MKNVTCPQCGGPALWSEKNRFRPFCSERCKLVDLNAWLTEENRINGNEPAEALPDQKETL